MINHSFEFYGIAFFGIILFRYFLVAGVTYLFFYSPFSQAFIHPQKPEQSSSWNLIRHDIKLSVISAGVFALVAAFIMSGYSWGVTRLYSDPQQYGLWYLGVSYAAC